MHENLTIEHTISLVTDEEVQEFRDFADKHYYVTRLIGNRDFDLFMWRISLDIYHLIGTTNREFVFAPDRAMISPLQYFLLNKFISSTEYKRLAHTKGSSKYERFLISIYLAAAIKRWTFNALNGEQDYLKQIFLYGDLFGFVHNTNKNVEELPLELLKMQANVMKKLRQLNVEEQMFTEQIKKAISEAKKLSRMLEQSGEDYIQWKITKLN